MKSTQDLIEEELLDLCQQGKFEAFLLFNTEGIPMAGVDFSDRFNADGLAALSVVLNQSVELTEELLTRFPSAYQANIVLSVGYSTWTMSKWCWWQ
jgi:hypothetical protein